MPSAFATTSVRSKAGLASSDEAARSKTPPCPVCRAATTLAFRHVGGRDYHRCPTCLATFLDRSQRPDRAAERHEYDLHRNDPDDAGYRAFLNRLAQPLLERLHPGAQGLDYGAGPGPALARMLTEAGHATAIWDPIYAPDEDVLARRYDFITCSEVVEHFHHPAEEFDRLAELLAPGGLLAVMTRFQTDDDRFAQWHYRRDPTHVVFYRQATMHTIAAQRRWSVEFPVDNVVFLRAGLDS